MPSARPHWSKRTFAPRSGQPLRAAWCLACLAWLVGGVAQAEIPWKPASGPLLTRWGKTLDPEQVWPEYPRPQLVRPRWQNLNGLWQFAHARSAEEAPPLGRTLDRTILVPFPVESALSGIGEPAERMWYRRTFQVPADWSGQRVWLHFGAVDWEARVWVNGQSFAPHRGGYDSFHVDITDALHPTGEHELVVGVFDPTDAGRQPIGKQREKPEGIWYTPSSGLWQTVWLEPVPAARIDRLAIVPDVERGLVAVTVEVPGADDHTVRVEVLANDATLAEAAGPPGTSLELTIPRPRTWSPDDPYLYDLRVSLEESAQVVDQVTSYFGLRELAVRPVDGVPRLVLNGEAVLQLGPLDQGFWPDGLYTAPSDEALRYDVELTKRLGFNMSRKHVKVEPDRWYYWCDKLGLLVWQDMPHNMRAPDDPTQFEAELERLIVGLGNHPSIVMWVVFNEGWGQYDTPRVVERVRGWDPRRVLSNASGWTDKGVGDVLDIHAYPGPAAPASDPRRARVLGEYGGLGLAVEGHTWVDKKNWSYRGTDNSEHLTASYAALMREVHDLHREAGLSAAVYTQLTDVEIEINGLLTYDREIIKVDLDRVAAANRGRFPREVVRVPTVESEPVTWRYVTEKPAAEWPQPGFADEAWQTGPGGFGIEGTPGSIVRTTWNSEQIWLRRLFNWEGPVPRGLMLRIHHDEAVKVYLNGVLAATAGGYTTGYTLMPLAGAAVAAIRPGENLLAVECRQTGGGQYIDVGLVELVWSADAAARP